jgi:SAM-dependent methyltransferase
MKDLETAIARRMPAGDERLSERLLAFAGPVAGLRLLDAGCGGGGLARRFAAAGARVAGLDASAAMLGRARSAAGAWVRGDARRLPFAAASFDLAACSLVLHYLHDPGRALGEIARVLRPGGRLVLADRVASSDPCLRADQDRIEWLRNPGLHGLRTSEELLALVVRSGLRVRSVEEDEIVRSFEAWIAGTDELRAAALKAELARRGDFDLGGLRIAGGEVRLRVAIFAAGKP